MKVIQTALAAVAGAALLSGCERAQSSTPKPTIVLVHGAFADSSSWNDVISILNRDGYRAIAAPDALRSVAGDAAEISALLGSIEGPVVLVGHSYGGMVISAAANGHANVKGLVFVSAFAPEAGETTFGLSAHDPGATLGAALAAPVPLPGGSHDLYIDHAKFPAQFAADVDPARAALMAETQRPLVDAAGNEPSPPPAWRTIPSYAIYGAADLNIPPRTLAFMAARAHSLHTVVVAGASHVVMISHPAAVAALIEEAASH